MRPKTDKWLLVVVGVGWLVEKEVKGLSKKISINMQT